MSYEIGILDQCPVMDKESPSEALQHSIHLAQTAESLGYKRFWVAEHHNMEQVASVSPEVFMSYLLAKTNSIEIGSGGVMIQHYSPYKVAENFHILANLAPHRVNVGIGKAPGGLHLSTKALQSGKMNDGADFEERLTILKKFLDHHVPVGHPLHGVQATPLPDEKLPIFLLGSSESSAKFATKLDAHFVFARFLNHSDDVLQKVTKLHQEDNSQRKLIVALAVLAAETEEKAKQLAQSIKLYDITFADGKTLTVQSDTQVIALQDQTTDEFTVRERVVPVIAGTAEQVKKQLDTLHDQYKIDEFIFHTPLLDRQARTTSFQLLGEAYEYKQKLQQVT